VRPPPRARLCQEDVLRDFVVMETRSHHRSGHVSAVTYLSVSIYCLPIGNTNTCLDNQTLRQERDSHWKLQGNWPNGVFCFLCFPPERGSPGCSPQPPRRGCRRGCSLRGRWPLRAACGAPWPPAGPRSTARQEPRDALRRPRCPAVLADGTPLLTPSEQLSTSRSHTSQQGFCCARGHNSTVPTRSPRLTFATQAHLTTSISTSALKAGSEQGKPLGPQPTSRALLAATLRNQEELESQTQRPLPISRSSVPPPNPPPFKPRVTPGDTARRGRRLSHHRHGATQSRSKQHSAPGLFRAVPAQRAPPARLAGECFSGGKPLRDLARRGKRNARNSTGFHGLPTPQARVSPSHPQLSDPRVLRRAGQARPTPPRGRHGHRAEGISPAPISPPESGEPTQIHGRIPQGKQMKPFFHVWHRQFHSRRREDSSAHFNHADHAPQRHPQPFHQQHHGASVANISASLSAWTHSS